MEGNLLVVDDNEANRDMLARRLRRQGYSVETAESGPVALRKIDEARPDLILLDVMMPGMSGLEVLSHLRQRYDRAALPILMATAKTDSEDVVQALALGANDYVTKPIDFPVLLARVASHLQTRAASGPNHQATELSSDGEAAPGTVLDGRFRVERTVGVGGFAIVFQATQLSTGQSVAVKVLRSHRAVGDAGDEHRRFETEMKLIGRLRHPHVVRLVDYGLLQASVPSADTWTEVSEPGVPLQELLEQDAASEPVGRRHRKQLPYIVMEYLEGDPLDRLLKKDAPLDVERAVELILPIASAVAEAHRLGIVHRDLKPPNVIVGRGPRDSLHPWVLDFGIARPEETEDDSFHRREDALIGTPEYMSPEQARGLKCDEKSDQYALGALLYEMVAGRRAFIEKNIAQLVQKVARGQFEPPRTLVPSVPEGLQAIILRAMDPLPDRRFSTVESFAKALLPFASEPVRGRWSSAFAVPTDPPPPGQATTVRPGPGPASGAGKAPARVRHSESQPHAQPMPAPDQIPKAPRTPRLDPSPEPPPGASMQRLALALALVGVTFAAIAAFLLFGS